MIALNEQAYKHLQDMIMNNELSYQEIYSETKLSKELGISRTPFRDAIHRLAQEGYIDIIPSKGFRLHQLSKQDVNETFQIRSAMECYCTLQITKNASSAKAKKLFRKLDMIMGALEDIMNTSRDIEEFSEYDFQFHIEIITYLENEQFSSIFATYMYRMKRLAGLSLLHEGRMEETYNEHKSILDCMKAGDVAHVYEITLQHMERPRYINLEDL